MRDLRFTRRGALTLGLGAFVVAAVPLGMSRRRRGASAHRRTILTMGTVAEIVVVSEDRARAMAALDAAVSELRAVDTLMTRYPPAAGAERSDVVRLNEAAGSHEPVAISAATAAVLRVSLDWAARSGGSFDPCVGRATAAWDPHTHTAPPEAADVGRVAGRELWRALDIDTHAGRPVARLTDTLAAVDLGGIAKGHAVDRAVRAIRALGIESALVNAGGDLYAMGRSGDGDPWSVGVRDPRDPTGLCGTLELEDAAVATSGDYENAFTYEGRVYHHILDPRTATPRVTSTHSLTIRAADCTTADAAATALFGTAAGVPAAQRSLRGTGAEIASRA